MQSRLDYLGVVEHHHGTLGQILRQITEHVMAYLSMTVEQQFGTVTLLKRKLGYPFIGQRIVELAYPDMFNTIIHSGCEITTFFFTLPGQG